MFHLHTMILNLIFSPLPFRAPELYRQLRNWKRKVRPIQSMLSAICCSCAGVPPDIDFRCVVRPFARRSICKETVNKKGCTLFWFNSFWSQAKADPVQARCVVSVNPGTMRHQSFCVQANASRSMVSKCRGTWWQPHLCTTIAVSF